MKPAWWRRLIPAGLTRERAPRRHENTKGYGEANRMGRMRRIGTGADPQPSPVRGGQPAWRYAFAAAAAALAIGGVAIVYQATSPQQSVPDGGTARTGSHRDAFAQPEAAPAPAAPEAMLACRTPRMPGPRRSLGAGPGTRSRADSCASGSRHAGARRHVCAQRTFGARRPGSGGPDARAGRAAGPAALSASHPPIIMGGMGGAPGIDGQLPERQISYELAAALPELGPQ